MKIRKFRGAGLNGYLDFDLEFYDDLTFVTGVNGTGKTTALNAIIALLIPKLDFLSESDFDTISLELDVDDEFVRLEAKKLSSSTELRCSLYPDDVVEIEPIDDVETMPQHRRREYEDEFFKEQIKANSKNPVMRFFEELPTPMYLGLDRRSISADPEKMRYYRAAPRMPSRRRNIFARSLGQSLDEAMMYAQYRFQEDRRKSSRIDGKFREKLVLELLNIPPIAFTGALEDPSKDELKGIERARKNMSRLPKLLGVSSDVISERVDPIFEFLDEKARILKKTEKKASAENDLVEERMNALIEWSFNKSQLSKINMLSQVISDHNNESVAISKRTNEFLDAVNDFLFESGKTLFFNTFGELKFTMKNDGIERDVRSLSSGEIQLLVILTHLYFNPEVDAASVFIIDEPELSLHVQWQEKFVDKVIAASTSTQFIMATHSPSIILDRVSNCIEIPSKQ